jgi:diguanylate cyclase (GGDEF)-like protein
MENERQETLPSPWMGSYSTAPRYFTVGVFILLFAGLWFGGLYSYPLFHSLAEMFSIVVAFGAFTIVWNSRRYMENQYFLFVGFSFLFVGFIDILHTLAYKGMNVFPGHDSNLPTQLWIAGRYFESLSLLIAPAFLERRLRVRYLLAGLCAAAAAMLFAIFGGFFPACFVEGQGLTPFKIASEYIVSLLMIASAFLIFRRREKFDPDVVQMLVAAMLVNVVSEMSFTLYTDPYGYSNMLGHYLKIIAYFLFYKAIIETAFTRPLNLLFRDLQQSEEQLRAISLTDELTGLYNRRGFLAVAEQQLRMAERMRGRVRLLFADLDGMKSINDTYGHRIGDQALVEVAEILRTVFRRSDILARLGGDEFAVLCLDTSDADAFVLVKRLQQEVARRNALADRLYRIALSLGISEFNPDNPCSLDHLMSRADTLMYEDKRYRKGEAMAKVALH